MTHPVNMEGNPHPLNNLIRYSTSKLGTWILWQYDLWRIYHLTGILQQFRLVVYPIARFLHPRWWRTSSKNVKREYNNLQQLMDSYPPSTVFGIHPNVGECRGDVVISLVSGPHPYHVKSSNGSKPWTCLSVAWWVGGWGLGVGVGLGWLVGALGLR